MQKKIALCLAVAAALLLSPRLQAQTLDQTIGGCGGVAPLRTIQANPSTYRSLLSTLQPGDRLLWSGVAGHDSSARRLGGAQTNRGCKSVDTGSLTAQNRLCRRARRPPTPFPSRDTRVRLC